MPTVTDRDLLQRWSRGDEPAFATLVDRHQAMVLAVARRVTGDHHVAEDVAQAVFLVLARKATVLSGGASDLGGWLHHVARDLARDRRASETVRRRREGASMGTEPSVGQPAEAQHGELLAQLDHALADLPERQRQCLVLHHLEGLPVAQVAERLAAAEGSVCQWLSRGRERLRRLLERRGVAVSSVVLLVFLSESSLRAAEGATVAAGVASPAAKTLATAYLRHHAWVRLAWAAGIGASTAAAALAIGAAVLLQHRPPAARTPPAAIPETAFMSNRTATLLAAAALATAPAIVSAADPVADPSTNGNGNRTLVVTTKPKPITISPDEVGTLAHLVNALKKAGCQVSVDPTLADLKVPFPDSGTFVGAPVAVLRQVVAATATKEKRLIEIRQKGMSDGSAGVWVVEPGDPSQQNPPRTENPPRTGNNTPAGGVAVPPSRNP